jgi:predicted metal-dependent phosphoesterase TrpH
LNREVILDLHNHSSCSYDATNRFAHYKRCFERGLFDVLAITDHNTLKAKNLFENDEFKVIMGEEIDTRDGELIGLFLEEHVTPFRPIFDTAKEIRARGGLVYLQHPYYRWLRKAQRLHPDTIHALVSERLIDIVEAANAGPFMASSNRKARNLARHWNVVEGAGSDAHHPSDIGRCTVAIQLGKDPRDLTPAELLVSLQDGHIRQERVRNSAFTLSCRLGYSVKKAYGHLSGAEKHARYPEGDK